MDSWVEEARLEYERRLKAREAYLGGAQRPEELSRKPDMLAKTVWEMVLQPGVTLNKKEMFEALIRHGWSAQYPERAFARAVTTNKESGNIFELDDGRFRRPTDRERAHALERRRRKLGIQRK